MATNSMVYKNKFSSTFKNDGDDTVLEIKEIHHSSGGGRDLEIFVVKNN